jgi:glycosyltransferase involved in cell wall biosynthesis
MNTPLVTAIVSTYNAEMFIAGCLADLTEQTLCSEMEILVIDSGSLQKESEICSRLARIHPQIKLLRTEREPLYVAWNRAIAMARGKYLTNANTDDRHRSDFMETMVQALENDKDVALTYADQFISSTPNETFAECEKRDARIRHWPDFTPDDLLMRCITGSQPMWRKSLHESMGGFNAQYRIVADYDLWLRFACNYELHHIPQTLGVFYDAPSTISGSNNYKEMDLENLALKKTHLKHERWRNRATRQRLAKELFAVGYRYIEKRGDNAAAAPFIRQSIRLDPININYMKTYLIRCLLSLHF